MQPVRDHAVEAGGCGRVGIALPVGVIELLGQAEMGYGAAEHGARGHAGPGTWLQVTQRCPQVRAQLLFRNVCSRAGVPARKPGYAREQVLGGGGRQVRGQLPEPADRVRPVRVVPALESQLPHLQVAENPPGELPGADAVGGASRLLGC